MAHIQVNEINAAIERTGAGWSAVENRITSLPETDRLRLLGVPLAFLEKSPLPETDVSIESANLTAPQEVDLRNVQGNNYIGEVKDQGNCGSCVSFGVVATIEGSACYKLRKDPAKFLLSEADLYFCFGAQHGANCDSGWIPHEALPHCVNPGLVDHACFPYSDRDQPCKLCTDASSRRFRIASSSFLTGNPTRIKNWIANQGPVIACFIVYEDFFAYASGVYRHVRGSQQGGHCVTIIGYNDSQQYWICKNSWDKNWGERGFFRIGYGECRIDSWENAGVRV